MSYVKPYLSRQARLGYQARMEEILDAIQKALDRKGISEAAASRLAGGNASVIKNLRVRRGDKKAHPIENLLKVAEVLDLEVYVGPPRGDRPIGFSEAEPPTYGTDPDWIVPAFHEETGQGKGPAGIAISRDWLASRGLDGTRLAVARVLVAGEVEGLGRDDLAVLDTRDQTLDGRPFAYFQGAMDRLRFGRLLQLPTGPTVVALADGSPLREIDRRAGMRVIGALVASFRAEHYAQPREHVRGTSA